MAINMSDKLKNKDLVLISTRYESNETGRAIYQVQNRLTRLPYSLKRYSLEKNTPEQIQRELVALNQLPFGIAPKCHDFWTEGKNAYLLIDWIAGKSLAEVFPNTPRDYRELERRLAAFEKVLIKVGQLHKHNRLHRDLKPDNIVFSDTSDMNSCELIDFGLSIQSRANVEGTVGFHAPEQYLLRHINLTNQTDIFALGQILCQLVSGDIAELIPDSSYSRWEISPEPFYPACVQQPDRFTKIIEVATNFEPRKRYATVWQFKNALKGLK